MNPWLKYFCTALAVLTIALVTDCTTGKSEWVPGRITTLWIKPAWTEFTSSGTGRNQSIETHYHPEEYWVGVQTATGSGAVQTWMWKWAGLRVGEDCQVLFKHGHLMTYGYLGIKTGETR